MRRNGRSRRSSGRRWYGGVEKKSKAPTLGAESIPGLKPGSQLSELLPKTTRAAPPTRTAPPKKTFQEELAEEMEPFFNRQEAALAAAAASRVEETDHELSEMLKDMGVECPRLPSEQESSRAESSHHKSDEANTTTGINDMWTNISLLVSAEEKAQRQQAVQAMAAAQTAVAAAPQQGKQRQQVLQAAAAAALPVEWRR